MRIALVAWVGLLAACNGGGSEPDSSGGGTGGGSGVGDDGPGMDGPVDGTGASVDLQHGTVKLEFRRGDGVADDPFAGTSAIQITLAYQACLSDFYTANPSWTPSGPDGASVFGPYADGGEGWQDRLCELGNVDCEVVSFQQSLGAASGSSLQVVYSVTGPIENRTLHFGPLPTASLAGCAGSDLPIVRVANNAAALGLDGVPPDGSALWNVQAFSPGEAAVDQGAAIGIDVAPVG